MPGLPRGSAIEIEPTLRIPVQHLHTLWSTIFNTGRDAIRPRLDKHVGIRDVLSMRSRISQP
ncbi:hypothetical protein RRSWK_00659 [Rhodopirellula sp. SWK7]|nr:hypothetical protein RRSWK_00659 [Rhodopirellula sp. SWK7]